MQLLQMVPEFKIGRVWLILLLEITPVNRLLNDLLRKGGTTRAGVLFLGLWNRLGSDFRFTFMAVAQTVKAHLPTARLALHAILQGWRGALFLLLLHLLRLHRLLIQWESDWFLC